MAEANEKMPVVTHVYNPDVRTLYEIVNRLVYEVQKDISVNAQEVHPRCVNKIKTTMAAFKAKVADSQKQPVPYPSKTHPTLRAISSPNDMILVENLCLCECQDWLCVLRDEVANSESARNASGVTVNDGEKWFETIDKLLMAFDDDMNQFPGLDFSESSPKIAGVLPGRRGLNPTGAA